MRFINTRTGEFQWVQDPRQVHYAILSHVWAKPDDPGDYVPEQTYQNLIALQDEAHTNGTLPISKFSDKLRRFCETALKDGFELAWADTCCIDKTSISELSTAIDSMYRWYGYSGACYAFLHDVDPPSVGPGWRTAFGASLWFQRGWTLQELIASRVVIFVCQRQNGPWEVLGSKHSLAAYISSVAGIEVAVLTFEKSVEEIPVARRMAWAAARKTTRLEDEAYCLLGIFGVTIPMNYGEGRYAFIRLQEMILSRNPDQTIFAWGRIHEGAHLLTLLPSSSGSSTILTAGAPVDFNYDLLVPPAKFKHKQSLLASSPEDFDPSRSANIVPLSREMFQRRLDVRIPVGVLYHVFWVEITPYISKSSDSLDSLIVLNHT